ncbi:DnaJ homolog subfamily C member 13 [Marchantia polymorpha subsp. ruderalis]|uniref:J domain-containing protein n=2 Tax=Marchantia polymorpha TaxID=3197 RepID=A0AAF6AMK3_MARPO|nr:hypothetical protein MARPO_0043s0138 [Marchantia polymorpha]BBM97673.1 hypothetical protein Mp_1g07450 [Marchantia polymorpha subsp. ruderalis]|eukprot:PTQ39916.1 hypothetical protein MARPO_0043s0138 [Marchantia polymorpha]
MDYLTRPGSFDPPPPPDPPVPEEPEYLARYMVTKHSWRGKYKRILCISRSGIVTLDPATLAVTNSYDLLKDFELASPVLGNRDDPLQQLALEFYLSVRTEGRGKFKQIRFSSRCRASILTELHRLRFGRSTGPTSTPSPVADFPVLHLKRRSADWPPFNLRITAVGVEVRQPKSGELHWSLDFRDMDSPGIIMLRDVYGRKGVEGGGFVLCPLYGRKCKAFMAGTGASNSAILSKLTGMARTYVGTTINVDTSQAIGAQEFLKQRAKAAVGAEETPVGEWSVNRLRSSGHGTASISYFEIGPKGGLGPKGDVAPRQLVLTKSSLVERRPDNYEAVIVRPLSAVAAVVRFGEEPQMFALEFNDGCPIHVYTSTSRDSLLAAVKDIVQSEGHRPLPVLPRLTMSGHYLDPPHGRVIPAPPSTHHHGPHRLFADVEGEALHVKHLSAAAKEAVAENGLVPGSKAKLWRRVREFNACVPYSGLVHSMDVPDVTLMALVSMLPAPPPPPADANPPPPPSPKAAATLIGLAACLRRLIGSTSAGSFVVSMPAAVGRIFGLLRNGSEGVSAEAAGLVAMLIGGGLGDPLNSRGERQANLIHAKNNLFGSVFHITILVNRLKPVSVSPLLSMAVVEVLEALLCEPQSESTDDSTFVELLRQVAGLRRRLFALFAHPAEGVRETVAVVMRTIAEEDGIAAESMRDAALRDGALLRHLVHAFFLPSGERREVSRQLVALWADGHQPALDLLSRVLPPGLVAYLHTRPLGDDEDSDVHGGNNSSDGFSAQRKQRRILQRRRGRIPRSKMVPAQPLHTPTPNQGILQVSGSQGTNPTNNGASASTPAEPVLRNPDTGGINISQSGAPVSDPQLPSTSPSSGQPTVSFFDTPSEGALNTAIQVTGPAPAQVSNDALAVGSGRYLCNWPEFWKEFSLDHSRADLIWNERTRQELREALKAEVHHLDLEKERTGDGSVLSLTLADQGSVEEVSSQLSWNYAEFAVRYPSLSKEVCVGQYYLRLLLEAGGGTGRSAHDFPLRDPVAFFRALYHRFLCDADVGLTVEGVNMDDLGTSGDWCDMGGLDGFGGGGGAPVRELCARAMAIVYEQHYQVIGAFDGTPHITVLLDRTSDRALRHRLLLLLKVLMKVPANAEASVAVGGCSLAVDLLTTAHEASERTAIPLQSNLIAATAFIEPQKEWHYVDKDGVQVGPFEKDAIRRAWSKQEVDWNTKCWASGMTEWKRLRDIRELRWALASKVAVLTPVQVGEIALSILHSMVSVHSDLDDAGELITPTPRVKRILSSSRCLPHIAQALLTGEPPIVEGAASLLKAIGTRNPKAMSRLYNTGAFYFALAYGGSNLKSVASLFADTHAHQAFHGGAEAAVSSSLPLAKRSVLGGLLPESLLYVLERKGPAAFASSMVEDSDNPEIIWTHKMRGERLIDQVLKHLGEFPQKLSQHCHVLYEYAPMPPVTYPELQDEMWCHRYYLRNLCDQIRFPHWDLVEHVEFLQSLLAMWREELTRKPMDLSEEDACSILEISLEEAELSNSENGNGKITTEPDEDHKGSSKILGRIDEEVLKRQYRRLAMRYHPDKNPEGREKFVAVQKAYERLQATLQGLQGPQPWRLQLLLKGQCILFSRYGDVLEPFKYAGYPMLLNAITVDKDDSNFLSPERAPLLEAASELAWLTCVSSVLNGEELVRDGGVSLLATLLSRCMCVVNRNTSPTDPAAVIVTNVMRTFATLSTFDSARKDMFECSGFVEDVVHCCELELATLAVDAALQTVGQLAASTDLQLALLKAGVMWYLLPLLLQYDSTAEKGEASAPQGMGNSVQNAKNMHAMLATRALARLGGFRDVSTPSNLVAANALKALLTPKLGTMLGDSSPSEGLLRNLNSNLESPEIIWNSATRAELLKFIEQQRISPLQDGSYDMTAAVDFRYKTLSDELQVGDVYLRVYNEQPDFEISQAREFCESLLEFINNIVERRKQIFAAELAAQEMEKAETEGEQVDEDAAPTPPPLVEDNDDEEQISDKDEMPESEVLVKNLAMALTSLQNILTANADLTAVFSTKLEMSPLFGCLVDTRPCSEEVPQLCLNVLARLTTHASCIEAMVADRSCLLLLLQLLHCSPACRPGALRVLYALGSTSELGWAAAKHGGAVYILQLMLPLQEEVAHQQRVAAASLLVKLVGQPMHGPRVAITLARFLPDGLVSTIRDGPGDAVIAALEQSSETPELVWSPAMAASLAAQLSTMAADLYREQTKGRVVEWDLPEHASGQQDMRDEPQVGGVYVRLFLKDPKFPLRNPKRFLEGLLDQYVAAAAATHGRGAQPVDPELPLLLSAALVSLLRVQPMLADHVGHLGYVPKLVAAMANEGRREVMASGGVPTGMDVPFDSDEGEETPGIQTLQERVRLSCLRVLHQLAASTTCAEAMATPGMGAPQVVPLLMKAIGWQGGSVLALETLKRVVVAGNRARDALVAQGLKVGLVDVLLGLLDWRAGGRNGLCAQMKWNESEASVGRVLAVEVLRAFAGEGAHSAKVQEILTSSEVWTAYKDQKHDLFLPSNAQSAAAGVAGLIEGSSSSVTYALPAPSNRSALVRVSPLPYNPLENISEESINNQQ